MNRNRVPTVFGPETRFEVNPLPPAPFRVVMENTFERLNARLLREQLAKASTAAMAVELRRAANEAAGLAWDTAYPLLFFPALFEEKVTQTVRRVRKQQAILAQTRELVAA